MTSEPVYYRVFWKASKQGFSGLSSLFSYSISGQTYEKGYILFNFIVSRFTNSLNVWLFCLSVAMLIFIYKLFDNMKDRVPLWLGMLVWMFFYYNESLNLMRQSLAGSIVLFAFRYVEQRKPVQYFVCIIVATLFHTGALIAALFYIISIILGKKMGFIKQLLLVSLSIGVLLSLEAIMTYFVKSGFLGERYTQYVAGGKLTLYINGIIIRLPILILLVLKRKKIAENIPEGSLLTALFFMETIFIQALSLSEASYRLAAFFGYGRVILLPQLHNIFPKEARTKRMLMKCFVIVYVFVWWGYYILLKNSNETLPYKISIVFV